ncbi:hypothetical protein XM53_00940 [Roseovarius atlanticus]|uniref:Uncharacterized protein n=1 Tax=Roseovarius atlanticus TaxID=1641875 RepID=A0A0T5NZL3_9RHOB|nr:hypothetical protein [Roseovarius atlanticus]KRS14330.1 hypothetical protein XM53_00940 [Roseovarius atlanticus]
MTTENTTVKIGSLEINLEDKAYICGVYSSLLEHIDQDFTFLVDEADNMNGNTAQMCIERIKEQLEKYRTLRSASDEYAERLRAEVAEYRKNRESEIAANEVEKLLDEHGRVETVDVSEDTAVRDDFEEAKTQGYVKIITETEFRSVLRIARVEYLYSRKSLTTGEPDTFVNAVYIEGVEGLRFIEIEIEFFEREGKRIFRDAEELFNLSINADDMFDIVRDDGCEISSEDIYSITTQELDPGELKTGPVERKAMSDAIEAIEGLVHSEPKIRDGDIVITSGRSRDARSEFTGLINNLIEEGFGFEIRPRWMRIHGLEQDAEFA